MVRSFYFKWKDQMKVVWRLRESADTDLASVQNLVKLGLYLKNWYDKQQASWEVKISKFENWISLRNLHRSGLDLLPLFQVLPSPAMVFTLIFGNSRPQNLRSFVNLLPKLDFTKFWRNTNCLCADSLWLLVWKMFLTMCQPSRKLLQWNRTLNCLYK